MLHNDGNAPAVVGMQLAAPMSAPSSVTVAAASTASIVVAPGDWSTLGTPVTRTLQISTPAATCSPTPAGVDLTVRYTDRAKTIAAGGTILATLAESGHVYEQWDTPNLGPVTRVSGLSGLAVEVAAYSFAACARLSTGGVRCWGNNVLGNGSSSSATPVDVTGISTATSLVAQRERVCAVLADGTVRCWGSDGCGCLLGTCPAAFLIATPQQVPNLSNVKRMALAQCHQCALQSNGTAMCWGLNWQGQLGDGTTGPSRGTPAPVQMQPAPFTTIAAGAYGTCATDTLGFLWCWGHALPYPQSSSPSPTPIGPLGVLSLQMLDVPDRTLALSSTMLSWWDPAMLVRSMPIVAKQVSAWSRLCVVRPDGRVACSPWNDPPVFTDVPGVD
jgi:hypothetical protein